MSSFNLNRRQFLGTSLVLAALPRGVWAADKVQPEDLALRYAVVSDVHFSDNPNSDERRRFQRALKYLGKSHFDALVIAGDVSNHGFASELTLFRDTLNDGLPKDTQALICMGNHEFYGGEEHVKVGGSQKLWHEIFQRPLNSHTVINGFHFIGISPDKGTCAAGDYASSLDWLREQLKVAAADDPKRPIFVFQHYHISETVYGSCGIDCWGIPDLRPVLDEYPQVINFSGHSHYPSNHPCSAWQGNFTAFGTSTLSYYEMTGGIFEKFPAGYNRAAQMYLVDVMKDGSVHLKIYDLLTESFFETEYLVAEPGNIGKYVYTNKRYETSDEPRWTDGATLAVSDVNPYGARFTFPQAVDPQLPKTFVGSYQICVEHRVGDRWELCFEANPWSQFYFGDMPSDLSFECTELVPDGEYRVGIRARNAFGKFSANSLTASFQTPKDAAVDRTAALPVADVLSFAVVNGAFQNTPVGGRFSTAMETVGSPKADGDWAVFDGKQDFCRVKFTEQEYKRLRRRITLGVRFQFDAFDDTACSTVFANTEGGGSCIELNNKTKQVEFWCHVLGNYVRIGASIAPGTHTVFGVYDGNSAVLYVDGSEAARQQISGVMTFTNCASARAFCIGADIAPNYAGDTFFKGKVQFARVYSWDLTAAQVKNLSSDAEDSLV